MTKNELRLIYCHSLIKITIKIKGSRTWFKILFFVSKHSVVSNLATWIMLTCQSLWGPEVSNETVFFFTKKSLNRDVFRYVSMPWKTARGSSKDTLQLFCIKAIENSIKIIVCIRKYPNCGFILGVLTHKIA